MYKMKKGKELELILKEIEKVRIPNAEIRSPDIISDIDTKTDREVDVGIHYKIGSKEIFIAIECRDRGSVQDIMWVEQLITKKRSVGADVLIAITSSSFTEPAKTKAYKNGILLRSIEKLNGNDIFTLTNAPYIEICSLGGSAILESAWVASQNTRFDYNSNLSECIFIDKNSKKEYSFNNLLINIVDLNTFKGIENLIPEDKSALILSGTFDLPNFIMLLPSGEQIDIFQAGFVFELTRFIDKYPVVLFLRYKDFFNNDLLAEIYEYEKMSKFILNRENGENVLLIDMGKWEYKDRIISSVLINQNETNKINRITLFGDFKAGKQIVLYGQK